MQLLKKALRTLYEEGVRRFVKKTIVHALDVTVESNSSDWYCFDLNNKSKQQIKPVNSAGQITLVFDESEAVMDWLYDQKPKINWLWNKNEIEVAKKYAHYYILIMLNGQKAGCLKVGMSKVYITDYDEVISVPEDTVFIYDTFIHPDFRGNRLAAYLVDKSLVFLKNLGYRYVWCHIPGWNQASIKTYKNCGFRPVAYIRFVRILRWKFFNKKPGKVLQRPQNIN